MSDKILFQNQQREFGPLIKLNDKLREILRDISDINVCTIIVVGDQSHGKTSVIERLTDISLPRGNQIQTRAPTEIRIKNIDENQEPKHILSYKSKNGDLKEIAFTMEELADLVRKVQTEMTGNDWDISFEPIYIEIQKKNHKDMTIIDLPGVTRVLHKKQEGNIEQKILTLYKKYMEPEQTIIINISNIMVDLDTSASFQLSNKIDPSGTRTILCFTKIDQFREKGLRQKIEYQIEKFNIDINNVFLIRNRTQAEAEESKGLKFVQQEEINLLNSNPELKDFPDNMKGIQALSKKVVQLQKVKIVVNLNKTHKLIRDQLQEVVRKIFQVGENLKTIQEIIQVINRNLGKIEQQISSNYDCMNSELSFFKEIYFTQKNNNQKFILDKKQTCLECSLAKTNDKIQIELKTRLSCRVKIEIRNATGKELITKEQKIFAEQTKVLNMVSYEKSFVKIVAYPNIHGDNIFSKFWKNEDYFVQNIDDLYKLQHFLQKSYLKNLSEQRNQLGKGFNSVSNTSQNFILTVLKSQILPSLNDQCQVILEKNYEQIFEDVLLDLFEKEFDEYPILKEELIDILQRFMNNQKNTAQSLKDQIIMWGQSCYTKNPLYQTIVDNLITYVGQFAENQKLNRISDLVDSSNFPTNQYIDLYEMDENLRKEILQNWVEYNDEIRIVFIIWAYWQVNLIRIKESLIPMLRYQFVQYVKQNVFQEILSQLQEYDEQTLKDLVKPDKATELKRQKLEMKKKMLEEAINLINDFCQKNPLYRRKILKQINDEKDEAL